VIFVKKQVTKIILMLSLTLIGLVGGFSISANAFWGNVHMWTPPQGCTNCVMAYVTLEGGARGNLWASVDIRTTSTGALTHQSSSNSQNASQHTHTRERVFPTGSTAFAALENRTTGRVIYQSRAR
jgi:hypothetical protein